MEPRIADKEAFSVMGVGVRGNPMQLDYQDIWGRQFARVAPALEALSTEPGYHGVYFGTDGEGTVDVIAGAAVAADAQPVEGAIKRRVPASTYAVFECTLATVGQTRGYIEGQWKHEAGYEGNPGCGCVEHFAPGCQGPDAPVVIYTAVRKNG